MKKYIKYIAVMFLAATLFSCESFLEEKTYTQLSDATFPATDADAEVMLNGAYSRAFKTHAWAHRLDWLTTYATPEAMYQYRQLHAYRATSDQWSWGLDPVYAWNWIPVIWQTIRSCNDVIGLIPNVEMDETRRAEIVAEAKFLRAENYFILVKLFGATPIVSEPVTLSDDLYPAKSTLQESYDFIVQDLKDAEIDAPSREKTIAQGRLGMATKGAAAGLLAKVYVYMATKPLENTAMWQEAKSQIDKVKTMGYSLIDLGPGNGEQTFHDLWWWGNENNEEFLFSYQSEGNNQAQHAFHYYAPRNVLPVDNVWCGGGQNGINYDLVEPEFCDWFYSHSVNAAGDTSERAYYTIIRGFHDKDSVWHWYNKDAQSAAYCAKFRGFDYEMTGNNRFPTNKPILRYADILLLESEVLNELGLAGKENGINAVRARAGLDPVDAGLSMDAFRDEVFYERRMEFAYEQDMLFDMRRRGYEYCKDLMENYYNPDQNGYPVGFNVSVEPHEVLFPWPANFMDANPNMVQNPGY